MIPIRAEGRAWHLLFEVCRDLGIRSPFSVLKFVPPEHKVKRYVEPPGERPGERWTLDEDGVAVLIAFVNPERDWDLPPPRPRKARRRRRAPRL